MHFSNNTYLLLENKSPVLIAFNMIMNVCRSLIAYTLTIYDILIPGTNRSNNILL